MFSLQVCKALTPYVHKDGSYLVRNSTRVPGSLTISVMLVFWL